MPRKRKKTLVNEPILLREDRDGVATLTLNRPDKFNALSTELMAMIQAELDKLALDRSVRVSVVWVPSSTCTTKTGSTWGRMPWALQ